MPDFYKTYKILSQIVDDYVVKLRKIFSCSPYRFSRKKFRRNK